jgi:hypothetical protein
MEYVVANSDDNDGIHISILSRTVGNGDGDAVTWVLSVREICSADLVIARRSSTSCKKVYYTRRSTI